MKKLTSFILAIMLIFATTTFSTFAVEYGVEIKNAPTKNYAQKFTDVPTDHWAFNYIGEMIERKVFAGYPDGKFRPSNTITRAEFAKIMIKAANISIMLDDNVYYSDVPYDHWARPFINNAIDYLTGYIVNDRLEFRPDAVALREDIAIALVKLKGYSTASADISLLSSMFNDYESISESAKKYVAVAVERGLISGYEDETFRAQQSITRAEASVLLWRAYQYGSDNKVVSETTPEVLPSTQPTSVPQPISTPKPIVVVTPQPTATPKATATPTTTPVPTPTPKPTLPPGSWSSRTLISFKGSFSPIQDMAYMNDYVYFTNGESLNAVSLEGESFTIANYKDIKLNDKSINVIKSVIGIDYSDKKAYLGLTTESECIIYSVSGKDEISQIAYSTDIKGADIDKILFFNNHTVLILTKIGDESTVYKVDTDGTILNLVSIKDEYKTIMRVTSNDKFYCTSENGKNLYTMDLNGYIGESEYRGYATTPLLLSGESMGIVTNSNFSIYEDRDAWHDTSSKAYYGGFSNNINEDSLPIQRENMNFISMSYAGKIFVYYDTKFKCIRIIKRNPGEIPFM